MWPMDWNLNFSISPSSEYSNEYLSNEYPSSEYSGLISFRINGLDLLAVHGTLESLLQYHSSNASVLWCSAYFIV